MPSKKNQKRSFKIDNPLISLFKNLNDSLYFKHYLQHSNYDSTSNHLFVSLGIGFKRKGEADLRWAYFSLNRDHAKQEFIFEDTNNTNQTSHADFWNKTPSKWVEEDPEKVEGVSVKFVRDAFRKFPGVINNYSHSEPSALGVLYSKKELFLELIRKLPKGSKIKVFQLGFHSFLDFCKNCENMIQLFQNNFKKELLSFLNEQDLNKRYLFSSNPSKFNRVAFLVHGYNNRPYNHKEKNYYFFDQGEEKKHVLETKRSCSYFKHYRPFSGELIFNPEHSPLLTVTILKPVKGRGKIETFAKEPKQVIPFWYRNTNLTLLGDHLYTKADDFISLITEDLFTINLTKGRLGVMREDITSQGYSMEGSDGSEVLRCLEAMQVCKNLRNLYLSGNWITSTMRPEKITSLLQTFQSLQVLRLGGCRLGSPHLIPVNSELVLSTTGLPQVALALNNLTNIQELDLSRNNINAGDFLEQMTPGISALKRLTHLNLSRNRLSIEFIRQNDNTKSQTLGATPGTPTFKALSWICSFFGRFPLPCKVNLKRNEFYPEDIDEWWDTLKKDTGRNNLQLFHLFKTIQLGIEELDFSTGSREGKDDSSDSYEGEDDSSSSYEDYSNSESDEEDEKWYKEERRKEDLLDFTSSPLGLGEKKKRVKKEDFISTTLNQNMLNSLPETDTLQPADFEHLKILPRENIEGLSIRHTPRKPVGHPEKFFTIDGIKFMLQDVSGEDMRCFFNAAGLEPDVEIAMLRSKCNDPVVRYMVANEIVSAVTNSRDLPIEVQAAINYTLYERERINLSELQELSGKLLASQNPDGNKQDTQILPEELQPQELEKQDEEIIKQLKGRALSLTAFNAFLNHHIRDKQMMVTLQDLSENGLGNYTSIDAVAYVNNMGIKIYRQNEEGDLELIHQFIPEKAEEVVYLYHEGVHFQALVPDNRGDEFLGFDNSKGKEKEKRGDDDLPPLMDD